MPAMWPTCLTRRKQPSSSKRPRHPSISERHCYQRPQQVSTVENQIVIASPDGTFGAYIARPKALPAPSVVVLHEVFGVNADIRKTCDELAEQGFIAVAPDLFWRQEPASTSASLPSPTGATAFASIRPTTETP